MVKRLTLAFVIAVPYCALAQIPESIERDAAGNTQLSRYEAYVMQRLEGEILPRLLAELPPAERRAVGSIHAATPADHDPYRFGLRRIDTSSYVIEVGGALMRAIDDGSDATAVAVESNRYRDLVGYARKYAGELQRQSTSGADAKTALAPPRFADYVSWPRAEYEAWRASSDYQRTRAALNVQTLAWIAAHFLEHRRLEARPAPASAIEPLARETAIDARASEWAYAAGYAPIPPLANAILFASVEPAQASGSVALCRAIQLIGAGETLVERDSRAARQLAVTDSASRYFREQRMQVEALRRATRCLERD